MSEKTVVFVQRFGNKDLFTGVPPETLWGWRRNVGLLIAILNRRGIVWEEKFARHLSDVRERADLFILRDWRYPPEEIYAFRARYTGTPVISMLFQVPQYHLAHQVAGEQRALLGIPHPDIKKSLAHFESALFATDAVVVRSKLNADLFAQLGHPRDNMVLLPHAPMWTQQNARIIAAEIPRLGTRTGQPEDFNVLFIGESFLRKGLFRLYRAFLALRIPRKRLHIYNRKLYNYVKGTVKALEAYAVPFAEQMLHDPAVCIHAPYANIRECVQAHHAIDLMLCPSLLDCGPNVIVEAHQLGTPVLATDLCGAVFDLPRGLIHHVAAPRWWHKREPAGAFTERLVKSIERFYNTRGISVQQQRPEVQDLLETIVQTWEDLLDKYL